MVSAAKAALTGERRVVTALFCDVVGSTTLAESMDPEEWGDLVGDAIRAMGEVVARFGGTVAEFGGDAVFAIFGAPTAHEDDPYRAVRAGMGIISRIAESAGSPGPEIQIRVGIHTGLVVAGDIEAGAVNTFSALGDTLNVAARLQTLAEPGHVVVSGATRRLLGSDVEVRDLGLTALKGRSAQVQIFEVVHVRLTDERSRGVPGLTSPMVGRQSELALLDGLAMAARAGTGRVAVVMGEPGVGKSRLLGELHDLHAGDPAMVWAVGRCSPFEEELPFHLLSSLVRSLAGIGATESGDVVAKAVRDLAERCGAHSQTTLLLRLVGVPGEFAEITPEALVVSYQAALVDVLRGLVSPGAFAVLVCEDVHWADPSSVEVVSRGVAAVPTLPVLLVMALRPERQATGWRMLESARRDLAESLTEIRLNLLDDAESRELLGHLLEIESLPPSLRSLVAARAEGNPFYLEEVVRSLIERGLVDRVEGRWVARDEVATIEVPDTIQGLLAARIDRLDPDVRRAGRVASVIGRQFSVSLFRLVYEGGSQAGLHPHLAALESHGLLRLEATTPELQFGFRHALIRDVMYEGLLRRERRELHHRVAQVLEAEQAERLEELAGVLAQHHERAGNVERAVHYLMLAGERALAQGARVESARFYAHARDLLWQQPNSDPVAMVDAVIGFASAGITSTPEPEMRRWMEAAIPLAEQLDDADRLAALYAWDAIKSHLSQADVRQAAAYQQRLDAAYQLLPRLTSRAAASLLYGARGMGLRAVDDFEGSMEPLSRSIDGLEAVGNLAVASFNASMLADSYSSLGRFAEADAAVERAMELGLRSGDPNSILDADLIRGRIAVDRGNLSHGIEFTWKGVEAAESVGNTFCAMAGRFQMGEIHMEQGDFDEAIVNLEKSTGLAMYCNSIGYQVLGDAWLASARARQGPWRQEDFEGPLQRAVTMGTMRGQGLILMQRAQAAVAHQAYDAAFADYEQALECFAGLGLLPLIARTELSFGRALQEAGRTDRAQSHMAEAERLFTSLGIETPDGAFAQPAVPPFGLAPRPSMR